MRMALPSCTHLVLDAAQPALGRLLESRASSQELVDHFQYWLMILNDQGNEVLWPTTKCCPIS